MVLKHAYAPAQACPYFPGIRTGGALAQEQALAASETALPASGAAFEPIAGYSRAVRVGNRVLVSGATATNGPDEIVCRGDAAAQTTFILDKIAASLAALGASLEDVVRTRVYLKDAGQWEAVARAHGRYFGSMRPANTMLEIARLIGDYEVEIEAEAVVD